MEMKNMIRKFKKQTMAVSPVIATLMLVLVSVGAAGAFYVWQSEWQGEIQLNAGEEDVGGQGSLVIAGSSTVYPFTVVAAELFEQNHPVSISISKGGSGAGEEGIRTGKIDIGCASHTVPDLEVDLDGDGNEDLIGRELVTQVATDAVVMVSAKSGFDTVDLTQDMVEDIYLFNGGYYTLPTDCAIIDPNFDGVATSISWEDFGNVVGGLWVGDTNTIKLSDRSDASGTEEVFTGKVTDIEGTIGAEQITTELTIDVRAYGNQDLVDEIAADNDVFGFMSLGIAQKAGGVLIPATYETIAPTTANAASGALQGARPLNYITLDMNEDGELDNGLAKEFIEFCLIPDINNECAHAADYISLYD